MQTLVFLSQKGGSGKTTLAVHTAVAAQEDGERVVIVDTDLQQSAKIWSEARKGAAPEVAPVPAAALNDVMAAARHDAMTLCIIDTAPHAAPDAVRVAKVADLVVIPCRPTAFDLAAVDSAAEIAKAAGARAVFVLSACPFRALEIAETRAELERQGVSCGPRAHHRPAGFRAGYSQRQGGDRVRGRREGRQGDPRVMELVQGANEAWQEQRPPG